MCAQQRHELSLNQHLHLISSEIQLTLSTWERRNWLQGKYRVVAATEKKTTQHICSSAFNIEQACSPCPWLCKASFPAAPSSEEPLWVQTGAVQRREAHWVAAGLAVVPARFWMLQVSLSSAAEERMEKPT